METEFSKEELERLVEVAALGDWMLNGHQHGEERAIDHSRILQKLYALAEEAGLGYLIETDGETGELKPSAALEARLDIAGYIADYDDCVFWDEAAIRLAERDLREEIGKAAFEAMPAAERQERVDAIAKHYDEEFEKHGLDRVRIEGGARHRRSRDAMIDRLKSLFDDKDASQ